MIRMRTRIIVSSIVISISLVILLLLFSASLSVSGVVYVEDSKACSSCHYESPYFEGWSNSLHGKFNVTTGSVGATCLDCHKSTPVPEETCLSCHENYEQSNKTQYRWDWVNFIVRIDAHAKSSHIGHVECKTCHIEHEFRIGTPAMATKTICRLCHNPYEGPKPAVR